MPRKIRRLLRRESSVKTVFAAGRKIGNVEVFEMQVRTGDEIGEPAALLFSLRSAWLSTSLREGRDHRWDDGSQKEIGGKQREDNCFS